MSDRVLVTGGAGFIGARLVPRLLRDGCAVRVLDNLNPQVHGGAAIPPPSLDGCETIIGDVRDEATVARALAGVDTVVHLAADTGTGQSMYAIRRYVDVNACGTATLLEGIGTARGRVRRLVLSSSRAVYGEGAYHCDAHGLCYPEPRSHDVLARGEWEPVCPQCQRPARHVPTDERAPARPVSVYGDTKLMQELLVRTGARAFGFTPVVLRYQNVYGSGQALRNPYTGILTVFFNALRAGRAPEVYEDGHESRDFVHVDDVVAATVAAVRYAGPPLVANVGSGVGVEIVEVARVLARTYASERSPVVSGRYRVGDIRHCVADLTRARRDLGYEPRVSLETGMREFVAWARDQPPPDDETLAAAAAELSRAGLLGGRA